MLIKTRDCERESEQMENIKRMETIVVCGDKIEISIIILSMFFVFVFGT